MHRSYIIMNLIDYMWESLLVILGGPLGQLFARALYLNGSLDKWWLLIPIFASPPFSIIALILLISGYVAQGQGANPLDYYLLITFIGTIIVPLLFTVIGINKNWLGSIMQTLLVFGVVAIPMFIRNMNQCQSVTSTNNLSNTIFYASIAHLVGIVFKVVMGVIIDYTPAGWVVGMLPGGEYIRDALLYGMGVTTAVLGTNMVQATNLQSFCSNSYPVWQAGVVALVAFVVDAGYDIYGNLSSGDSTHRHRPHRPHRPHRGRRHHE
jgi:hypothetical protein